MLCADTRGDVHPILSPWTSTTALPVLSLLPADGHDGEDAFNKSMKWSKFSLYEFSVTGSQGYIKFNLLCLTLKTEASLASAELFEAHNNYNI